jgi:hypothetical protein
MINAILELKHSPRKQSPRPAGWHGHARPRRRRRLAARSGRKRQPNEIGCAADDHSGEGHLEPEDHHDLRVTGDFAAPTKTCATSETIAGGMPRTTRMTTRLAARPKPRARATGACVSSTSSQHPGSHHGTAPIDSSNALGPAGPLGRPRPRRRAARRYRQRCHVIARTPLDARPPSGGRGPAWLGAGFGIHRRECRPCRWRRRRRNLSERTPVSSRFMSSPLC